MRLAVVLLLFDRLIHHESCCVLLLFYRLIHHESCCSFVVI